MNPFMTLFAYLVWFCATYYVVFLLLVLFVGREKLYERKRLGKWRPKVSVVVPAYNEGEHIAHTITSLKKVTYPNVEFLIINDGSSDHTAKVVRANITGDSRFRFIDNRKNRGKASVLNIGIKQAKGEFVATMDADSMIEERIFEKTLPYFKEDEVGAVTVTVEVADDKRFLHKIFDLEYIIGLSLFLKVFSFIDSLFVTPGPFSVYRKAALQEVGGFDPENITEDMEIAYRLQKDRWRIRTCMEAKVHTFIPPTFKGLYVQRRRWYSGAIQTLMQHKGMLFNRKYGAFGFVMPFNYLIIALGIALFLLTGYRFGSNVVSGLWNLQYTGFNLFSQISVPDLDILRLGYVELVGLTGFLATFALVFFGLIITRKSFAEKRIGIASYPALFILYQIFWIGAIWNVARGKKVKWR